MNKIRSALQFIDAHDRETWVRMGMATKAELGDAGFDLWDEWSRQAKNYCQAAAKSVWRSIKCGGGITAGTLFHEARQLGWRDDESAPDPQLSAARLAELEKRRAEEDAAIAKRREIAKTQAAGLLRGAVAGTHPYLKAKGFPEFLMPVTADGALLVPMRDAISGELIGMQTIRLENNEWEKKFIFGQRSRGAIYRLGEAVGESILCEGLATGLSVSEAAKTLRLRLSVVVCFSAGNLAHVASLIGGRKYAFADNDLSGAGEKAARQAGIAFVMSDQVGQDANDLHQAQGIMAVCKKLLEVRKNHF